VFHHPLTELPPSGLEAAAAVEILLVLPELEVLVVAVMVQTQIIPQLLGQQILAAALAAAAMTLERNLKAVLES
jgi:hypothetical protein